ncbi:hypothetical protein MRU69_11870 [Kocuria flava]|uniref:hypothetical protein n=1 Tax=Kocuria flava TaxID=446860 RepID=UPI001FF188BB|nr:hypothetical protein [Kocuria flava]MCJ8505546.1 hypothetical protein [Kocuria flava]
MRVIRVTEQDDVLTSVGVSRIAFPVAADEVCLVEEGQAEAALVAGVTTHGPVLFVPPCPDGIEAVPQEVVDEVLRLAPATITVVGNRTALCEQLVAQVAGLVPTRRAEGDTPTAISLALSRLGWDTAEEVYVLSAPLTGGALPAGSLSRGPVLLVPFGDPVPDEVIEEVTRLEPGRVIALGDPAILPDEEITRLAGRRPWLRLAGQTETATAIEISRQRYPSPDDAAEAAYADTVYLSAIAGTGLALGAAAGGATDGPVLPVPPECQPLSVELADEITRLRPSRIVAVGDAEAVCAGQLDQAIQATDVPAMIRKGLLVLNTQQRASLVGVSNEALCFEASTTSVTAFTNIEFVASEPAPAAPAGLLRRVVEVVADGSKTVVTTEPAAIDDVVIEGRASLREPLVNSTFVDQSGRASQPRVAAVDTVTQGGPVNADLSLTVDLDNEVIYERPGSVKGGRFTASGPITIGALIEVELDIRQFRVRRFLVRIEIHEEIDLTFTAGPSVRVENQAVTLAERILSPLIFYIGPLPVVVVPTLVLEVGAEAGTTVLVAMGFKQQASAEVGIEYADGRGWHATSRTRAPDPTFQEPPTGVAFDALGRVTASLQTLLYDTAGPEASLDTYLQVLGQLPGPPMASLSYGLRGRAAAAVQIPIIGNDLGELDVQLFNLERPLWQWPPLELVPAGEHRFSYPAGGVMEHNNATGQFRYDVDAALADFIELSLAYTAEGDITVGMRVREPAGVPRQWESPPPDESAQQGHGPAMWIEWELTDDMERDFSVVCQWDEWAWADAADEWAWADNSRVKVTWRDWSDYNVPIDDRSATRPAAASFDGTFYRLTFPASFISDPSQIYLRRAKFGISLDGTVSYHKPRSPVGEDWTPPYPVRRPATPPPNA